MTHVLNILTLSDYCDQGVLASRVKLSYVWPAYMCDSKYMRDLVNIAGIKETNET